MWAIRGQTKSKERGLKIKRDRKEIRHNGFKKVEKGMRWRYKVFQKKLEIQRESHDLRGTHLGVPVELHLK